MPTGEKGTLIGALLELGEKRRSGVLTVRAEEVTTVVVFEHGSPVDATEEGTHGETLGRLLVRTHVLSAEQHAKVIDGMASAIGAGKEQKFGESAVALGFLSKDKLEQALKDQIRWRIVRTLQRDGAEWSFDADAKRVQSARKQEISMDTIVLDAVRWFPEERRRAAVQGREPFFASLRGQSNAVARRFGMTLEEQTALEALDGTSTVEDLVSVEPSVAGADISSLLVALLLSGVLELSDSPRPSSGGLPSATTPSSTRLPAARTSQPPRANDRIAHTVARLKRAQAKLPEAPPEERAPKNERESRVLAEQCFQHGQAHLRANRLQQAVPLLRRAFGLMPRNLEYELYAMWTEVRVHHTKPTLAQLSALRNIAVAAIRQEPNLAFAYYVLGHVMLAEGSEVMAKRHFAHALRLDPDAIDAERHIRVLKRREVRGPSRVPQVRGLKPPPPVPDWAVGEAGMPVPSTIPKDRASGQAVGRVALKKAFAPGLVEAAGPAHTPSAIAQEEFALYAKTARTLELPPDMETPLPGPVEARHTEALRASTAPSERQDARRSSSPDRSPLPDGPSSLTAVSRVADTDLVSPPPGPLPARPPSPAPRSNRTSLYAGAAMTAGVLLVTFAMFGLRANRGASATARPSATAVEKPPAPSPSPSMVTPIPPPSAPLGTVSATPLPTAVPPSTAPVTPPPSVASAPAPAPEAASASASASREGKVVLPRWASQRRVYVDGKLQGNGSGSLVTRCGRREIKIGSSGTPKVLDVPCGGSIEW